MVVSLIGAFDIALNNALDGHVSCGTLIQPPADVGSVAGFGSALALTDDGLYIGAAHSSITGPFTGAVFSYAPSGELRWTFAPGSDNTGEHAGGQIVPNGAYVAVSSEPDHPAPRLPVVHFLDAATGVEVSQFHAGATRIIGTPVVAADVNHEGRFWVGYDNSVFLVDAASGLAAARFDVGDAEPRLRHGMLTHDIDGIQSILSHNAFLIIVRGIPESPQAGQDEGLLEVFDATSLRRLAGTNFSPLRFFLTPGDLHGVDDHLWAIDRSSEALVRYQLPGLESATKIRLDHEPGRTGTRGLVAANGLVAMATGGGTLEELGLGRGQTQLLLREWGASGPSDAYDVVTTETLLDGNGWAHTFAIGGDNVIVGAPSARSGETGYVRTLAHDGTVKGVALTCAEPPPLGPCPEVEDWDRDGLPDRIELAMGTNPCGRDTDEDGVLDGIERAIGINPLARDTDLDGLTDHEELRAYWTDPGQPDTDGDGHSDGDEVSQGSNPLDPEDPPTFLVPRLPPGHIQQQELATPAGPQWP